MACPIRDYSTNTSIGEFWVVYNAIKKHLDKNPPKKGDKKLIDYLHEVEQHLYPQIMRTTTTVRPQDAYFLGKKV